jgi:hypothetical protein
MTGAGPVEVDATVMVVRVDLPISTLSDRTHVNRSQRWCAVVSGCAALDPGMRVVWSSRSMRWVLSRLRMIHCLLSSMVSSVGSLSVGSTMLAVLQPCGGVMESGAPARCITLGFGENNVDVSGVEGVSGGPVPELRYRCGEPEGDVPVVVAKRAEYPGDLLQSGK